MNSLYIIIPAYNESLNIEKCVNDWYPVVDLINKKGSDKLSRLVIIDDGSSDNTFDLLKNLAVDRPYLTPMTRNHSGHGSTVLYGYRYAINKKADYIFQTDSDGQTDPKEFEKFWNNKDIYDAIIGKRVDREDGIGRKYIEIIICSLLRLFFGIKVEDANAPFRLMKTSLLTKYIDRLPQDCKLPNIMFTTFFTYYKENIIFSPISFKKRVKGKSSINIIGIVKNGLYALKDFKAIRTGMNHEYKD